MTVVKLVEISYNDIYIGYDMKAVSYTHLDVYKRQPFVNSGKSVQSGNF